ncbi:MAG: hypothetical protein ACRD0D_01015 [Acidimicrobiales bacterium]
MAAIGSIRTDLLETGGPAGRFSGYTFVPPAKFALGGIRTDIADPGGPGSVVYLPSFPRLPFTTGFPTAT